MRCAMRCKAGRQIVEPRRRAQAFAGKDHVGRNAKQRIVLDGRPVGVEHDRNAATPRRLAHRPHQFGETVVGEEQRNIRDQSVGIGDARRLDPLVAVGDDHPLAGSVDHDARHRRGGAGDAHHARGVDAFARHVGHELVADIVVVVAERPGVMRAAAEPRHRDRGVDRAAAADHDELVGHALAAGLRKLLDPEHDVLHRDAGAQDGGRARRGHRRSPPRCG